MGLIENIISLSEGHASGNIETLLDFVVDGKYTPFQELVKDCKTFSFNGQELLIYGGKNGTMSANVTKYCDQNFITTMYDKSGLIYDSKFSYDTDINNCLYDLYDLKKHNPTSWIYNLVEIYDTYGTDTTNTARWLYGYNAM